MTFARLSRADAVAMIAAFALLLSMGMTWYSTTDGDAARQIEDLAQPRAGDNPDLRSVREDARLIADGEDKNAWQEPATVDRLILAGLLATVVLAVGAGYLRAADKRFDPPFTPSAAAALAATVTALLVAYRILQEPGLDSLSTVEAGAPIGLGLLAVIAFSSSTALRAEEDGTAWREPATEEAAGDDRPTPFDAEASEDREPVAAQGEAPVTAQVAAQGEAPIPTQAKSTSPHTYDRDPLIDREQVLHVALLARLRLEDDEVERMTGELSSILEHIEKISELDLDDVAPTSHVVELENVLRADRPRRSLPRKRVLAEAPDTDGTGFRVPSPGA